jgi:hypothetical protein
MLDVVILIVITNMAHILCLLETRETKQKICRQEFRGFSVEKDSKGNES